MSKQHIEVEGGELAIRNSYGDIAIVPKYDREKVQKMIDAGCNTCIDRYVSNLPRLQDYAADGSLYPDDPPIESNNGKSKSETTNKSVNNGNVLVFIEAPLTTYKPKIDYLYPHIHEELYEYPRELFKDIKPDVEFTKSASTAMYNELYDAMPDIINKVNQYNEIHSKLPALEQELADLSYELDTSFDITIGNNIQNNLTDIERYTNLKRKLDEFRRSESELNNILSNHYNKIDAFLADVDSKEIDKYEVSIPDPYFIRQGNALKNNYKGDKNVKLIPLYDDFELLDTELQNASEKDEVVIMGHSGGTFFGIPNEDIASKIKDSNVNNLYLGTCNGQFCAPTFKESADNVYYVEGDIWNGVNPYAKDLKGMMYGNKYIQEVDDYIGESQMIENVEEGKHYKVLRNNIETNN